MVDTSGLSQRTSIARARNSLRRILGATQQAGALRVLVEGPLSVRPLNYYSWPVSVVRLTVAKRPEAVG
jgi:hypothetical protein